MNKPSRAAPPPALQTSNFDVWGNVLAFLFNIIDVQRAGVAFEFMWGWGERAIPGEKISIPGCSRAIPSDAPISRSIS